MFFIHYVVSILSPFIQPAGYLLRKFVFIYCEILFLLSNKQIKSMPLKKKKKTQGLSAQTIRMLTNTQNMWPNQKHLYYFPLLPLFANKVPCLWPSGTLAHHQELCMSFRQSVMLTYHNIGTECSSRFAEFVHLPQPFFFTTRYWYCLITRSCISVSLLIQAYLNLI